MILTLGVNPNLVVRSKPDAKFWIKDKEERAVPLPQALVESLKLSRERYPTRRWVLGTSSDKPNTHLFRDEKFGAFLRETDSAKRELLAAELRDLMTMAMQESQAGFVR